jgi:hypothetical protein
MAILRVARDSHYYVVKGYPISGRDGNPDFRFTTYQADASADIVFDVLRIKDGDLIEPSIFYGLLSEGSLFNDHTTRLALGILFVPKAIRTRAEALIESQEYHGLWREVRRNCRQQLKSVLCFIEERSLCRRKELPTVAGMMTVAWHHRVHVKGDYAQDSSPRCERLAKSTYRVHVPGEYAQGDTTARTCVRIPPALIKAREITAFLNLNYPTLSRREKKDAMHLHWRSVLGGRSRG